MDQPVDIDNWNPLAIPAVELLENLPIGIMVCDGLSQIRFSNRIANLITAQGDGLCTRRGVLLCNRPTATRNLHDHIRSSIENADSGRPVGNAAMSIERASCDTPLLVIVTAVVSTVHLGDQTSDPQPLAVVYVSDFKLRRGISESLLARLFRLTFAEARLLKVLVDGKTLKEASHLNQISEGTARGYLKRIFCKTGTNRQSELIRLVSNSPAWLMQTSDALT